MEHLQLNNMEKPIGHYVGYFAGIVLCLALLSLGLYFVYLLVTSSDQTRLAVLTAVVSIGTLVYTQSKNTKREVEGRQFSKKAEAYEEILSTITSLVKDADSDAEPDPEALAERLRPILPKLMIWAGPDVLKAWQRMATPSDDPIGPLIAGNDLIASLRKELGHHSDSQLGPLGLVSTFIRADERPNRHVV